MQPDRPWLSQPPVWFEQHVPAKDDMGASTNRWGGPAACPCFTEDDPIEQAVEESALIGDRERRPGSEEVSVAELEDAAQLADGGKLAAGPIDGLLACRGSFYERVLTQY